MAAKYPIFISILAKIWKTPFPMEFFNAIWLKVGEHDYPNITEITLKKMAAKTFFDIAQ